jgi:hypothetical protein
MAEEKRHDVPEVAPELVDHLVQEADKSGVPPTVAKWIIKDAVADGVGPDKVADVVKEAIEVESEDQEAAVYRTQLVGHKVALWGLCDRSRHPRPPGLGWASVAVLFQQPVLIVAFEVCPDRGADRLDVLVDAPEDDLLLQRSDEPLGDAVGLGLADEGEAGRHAENLQLLV